MEYRFLRMGTMYPAVASAAAIKGPRTLTISAQDEERPLRTWPAAGAAVPGHVCLSPADQVGRSENVRAVRAASRSFWSLIRPQPQGPRQPARCDAAAPRWPARSPRPSPRACGRAGTVSPRGPGCGAPQPPTMPCGARDRRARDAISSAIGIGFATSTPVPRPSDRWSRTADASSVMES